MTPLRMKDFAPLLYAHLGLALLVGGAAILEHPPVLINETPSMAKGAYVRTGGLDHLRRGDIVAWPMTGAAKSYLGDQLGYPADTRLIKRVAAISGDVICRKGARVTIHANVQVQAHAQVRTVIAAREDHNGRALPQWRGCLTLGANQVFLLGDHPSSFDSRYLGPVRTDTLMGTYRGVLIW